MEPHHRRGYFLLKLVIFFYPTPDLDETDYLMAKASAWQAEEDRRWATNFVEENPATAFERTRAWFSDQFATLSTEQREVYLTTIWRGDNPPPYVTEMQGLALMRLAQEWGILPYLKQLLGRETR